MKRGYENRIESPQGALDLNPLEGA